MLRYATDFVPRLPDPTVPDWRSPMLSPELFYDRDRHVLELLPIKPKEEVQPLPGIAVDVDGEIYRVDPVTGEVLARRCDGSEVRLLSDYDVLAAPAGLALDRRGYLYIADPMAKRVVVVLPDDGSVAGVLVNGLQEPVDVVVAAGGAIYVADRAAGRIVRFNQRFERWGDFEPRNDEGLPANPRPIAVMIDADGSILVADANHPRLLCFAPNGEPLADVELHSLVQALAGGPVALDALRKVYGRSMPRFLGGVCEQACRVPDGGDRLVEVHRALRLLMLRLDQSFEACGTFVSAALDGGTPGVEWHKVEIDAELPSGTWLKIQTVTADQPDSLDDPNSLPPGISFQPFEDLSNCAIKPILPPDVPDRLIFSSAGRYLRLRLVLGSDGTATPSIRAIRIFYPRVSYLDLLPRVYRREPESALFLEHFLALFEHIFTEIEDRYELFSRELSPDAAPLEILNWLACLIDLSFDPSWPLDRRRALVLAAMELYRTRGTVRGIERYVQIYTGIKPVIIESFLERPHLPSFVGLPGNILGCRLSLAPTSALMTPEDLLLARYALRFTVFVYITDQCDEAVMLGVVNKIVETSKPAHTVHLLRAVHAGAPVGHLRVGIDLMLGAREAVSTRLGGRPQPGAPSTPPATLGVNSVLGEKRPQYVRPLGHRL
jgi:phage tail-like protein